MTDDPNGTKPTDIIGDSLEQMDAEELAETLERPIASEDLDAPQASADDTEDALFSTRGHSDLATYIKRHAVGLVILLLVSLAVVLMLVRAWRRTNNVPDLEFIEGDARARIEAPTYSGGYYGDDDHLILTQVTVGTRQHSERAPEGSDLDETFGAMGYVTADVMLSYQNESVIATKTAVLGYARQSSGWIVAGDVSNEQVSYIATAGVDQRKVLRNIGQILERASSISGDDQRASLATIYEGASFEITSSAFDEVTQTDTLTIHARKGGLFSAYECDIVASFAFTPATGLWELTDATVTDDAWTRRFDPLVGTWTGTFKSQTTSEGTKCLAGSSTPMVITITSWENAGSGARISGTLSAVAHHHPSPSKNQNATEGDLVLEEVPFTATLTDPDNKTVSAEAVFTVTLPETTDGKVSLTLLFGTGSDGAGVTASVITEHHFEDTLLLIPYQKQVIYTDTYDLALTPGVQKQKPEQSDRQQGAPAVEAQTTEEAAQDSSQDSPT